MTIGFPQFYSLRYKQGLGIPTACCGMRKTDQDISSYSVLKFMIFLNESISHVEERKQQIKRNTGTYISSSVKAWILIKLNFILYTAGKFMQRRAPIVTGAISKEFIGECWTDSVSVLTQRKLKIGTSVLPKLQFLCVSRANLRKKKHDVFTLKFSVQP